MSRTLCYSEKVNLASKIYSRYNRLQIPQSMIIYFHNIKKEFFTQTIFAGVKLKLTIEKSEKIGVVAKNGEGKTTFLKILAGVERADAGDIVFEPKRTRHVYVAIDQIFSDNAEDLNRPVEDYVLSLDDYLFGLKKKMDELSHNLEDLNILEIYGETQAAYDKSGGYDWEEKVSGIIKTLNLEGKKLKNLSGGEKSRMILAAIQVIDADLILLDEPTNHLDIIALEELEDFIKNDKKSYIIASHDQRFLDNVVTKIITILEYKIRVYPGNYSQFRELRELELSQQQEEFEAKKAEITRLQNLAKKTRQRLESGMLVISSSNNVGVKRITNVQGQRRKVARDNDKTAVGYFNDRISSRQHDVEIINRRIGRIDLPKQVKKDWGIKLDFNENKKSPDIILRTKDLSIEVGSGVEKREFIFPDVIVMKGEKVAIIGPNGIGKSTFAKIVAGEYSPKTGEVNIPESVSVGYYSQTHDKLIFQNNVLQNLLNMDRIDDYNTPAISDARNFLHQLLFEGDMALQKVKDLSQGEKSKLALAKIIYEKPNFLLLDEPTNHLDIPSKERIEEALRKYSGTLLVISHDRFFMEKIGVARYIELS